MNSGAPEELAVQFTSSDYNFVIFDIFDHQYVILLHLKVADRNGRTSKLVIWKHPGNDATGMLGRCEKVVGTCEKVSI